MAGLAGVGLVNDDDIGLRPVTALAQGLRAGDLVRHVVAAPVVGLHDAVGAQAVGVGSGAGLVDQRGAIANKHHTAPFHQRFEGNPVAQVGLARTCRGHDHLAAVADAKAIAQRLMGGVLELARWRERRAGVVGLFFPKRFHHRAHG